MLADVSPGRRPRHLAGRTEFSYTVTAYGATTGFRVHRHEFTRLCGHRQKQILAAARARPWHADTSPSRTVSAIDHVPSVVFTDTFTYTATPNYT